MSDVEIRDLSMVFRSERRTVAAIEGLSLSASSGEFLSIIGPSGSGKSTLLKLIGDLLEPSSGSVTVDGLSSHEARIAGMFSYVFQNPVLLPWRTVIDNVRLPSEILHRSDREPGQLLEMVGLGGFEHQYPGELSGGMQQRAALARALTFDPKILLMDEPFGALDELTRNALNLEVQRVWREIGVTVFFVTHSISEAVAMGDRVVVLSARPARVAHVETIGFPRPREESLKESPEFQEIVRCLRERLE